MEATLGSVSARLSEPIDRLPDGIVDLLNNNIKPPTQLSESDVYIRALHIVSDQINSFGGRFPVEEHDRLVELLVDSPVMVGHRKDHLPLGRTFHALLVEIDGRQWVKSYFYWLKNADGADSLRQNIDGGVCKECSVAFTFRFPECSVCGRDIRRCEHMPFESYATDEGAVDCHFNYRKIEKILETSLVYRGAVSGTSITRSLSSNVPTCESNSDEFRAPIEQSLSSLKSLPASSDYLIVPYYDGLPVTLESRGDRFRLRCESTEASLGEKFQDDLKTLFRGLRIQEHEPLRGYLIGYRGKERCRRETLIGFLKTGRGPVRRLELKLLPGARQFIPESSRPAGSLRVGQIRHAVVGRRDVSAAVRRLATSSGVRIIPLRGARLEETAYWYNGVERAEKRANAVRLTCNLKSAVAHLSIIGSQSVTVYRIEDFNYSRFRKGARFVARELTLRETVEELSDTLLSRGWASRMESVYGPLHEIELSAVEGSVVRVCPARLKGQDRFLVYVSEAA